jgi:hypothetical protein
MSRTAVALQERGNGGLERGMKQGSSNQDIGVSGVPFPAEEHSKWRNSLWKGIKESEPRLRSANGD